MTIGDFLEQLRREKGLTQAQVAEALNVSDRTISAWETGKRLPDVLALSDLAAFYDVTADEILHGRRNTAPEQESPQKEPEISEEERRERKKRLIRFSAQSFVLSGLLVAAVFLIYASSCFAQFDYSFTERQPYFVGLFVSGMGLLIISFAVLTAFYQIAKPASKIKARRIYFRPLFFSAWAMIIGSLITFFGIFTPLKYFWLKYLELCTDGNLVTAFIFAILAFAICFIGNYVLHRDVIKTGNRRVIAVSARNRKTLVGCYIYGCIPVFLAILTFVIFGLWQPKSYERLYEGTMRDIIRHLQTITVPYETEELSESEYSFDFTGFELTTEKQLIDGFYCNVSEDGAWCHITRKEIDEDGREFWGLSWSGRLIMVGNTPAYNFRYGESGGWSCTYDGEPLIRESYSYRVSMNGDSSYAVYLDTEYTIAGLGLLTACSLVTADIIVCIAIYLIRYKRVPLELE